MIEKIVKSDIMLKLSLVLLSLVLITSHFAIGLYAKYSARDAGASSARVAAWNVSATGGKPALSIDCSTSVKDDAYKITVLNQSEVSASYDVIVVFTTELSSGVALSLDGTRTPTTEDRKTFVFSDVGTLLVNQPSAEHQLIFTADPDAIVEDEAYTFHAEVIFEQID